MPIIGNLVLQYITPFSSPGGRCYNVFAISWVRRRRVLFSRSKLWKNRSLSCHYSGGTTVNNTSRSLVFNPLTIPGTMEVLYFPSQFFETQRRFSGQNPRAAPPYVTSIALYYWQTQKATKLSVNMQSRAPRIFRPGTHGNF